MAGPAGTSPQQTLSPYGPDLAMQRNPLLQAAAIFGTLVTELQDSLPRWETAAEAGAQAVGKPEAVTKYETEVLTPLMEVVRAVNQSVNGFSRALSQTVVTYTDADTLSAQEFDSIATPPVSDG
jgi:hypothetical protein